MGLILLMLLLRQKCQKLFFFRPTSSYKGGDNAIKAFVAESSLPKRGFRFLIAGKGNLSYHNYLVELIGELRAEDRNKD